MINSAAEHFFQFLLKRIKPPRIRAIIKKPSNPLWIVSTGKAEIQCATPVINPAGKRITKIISSTNHGAKGDTSAAMNPITVMGATTGAANKFATMLMGDRYPDKETRIGEQNTIAAIGGASAPASFLWVGNLS